MGRVGIQESEDGRQESGVRRQESEGGERDGEMEALMESGVKLAVHASQICKNKKGTHFICVPRRAPWKAHNNKRFKCAPPRARASACYLRAGPTKFPRFRLGLLRIHAKLMIVVIM